MREIKFRGQRKDNGEWAEGDLVRHYIPPAYKDIGISIRVPEQDSGFYEYEVHPETVGQYTGLKDKNGKPLDWWEDDLLQSRTGQIGIITYNEYRAAYEIKDAQGNWLCSLETAPHAELTGWHKIGNRHQNPELLEKQ